MMSNIFESVDERIPILIGATIAVSAFSLIRYRREKSRLHRERGYDAHDPNIDKEAWLNTKTTLRDTTKKGRLWVDVIRGFIFFPFCTLLAIGMCWAGLPSNDNAAIRWDMMGIAALAALGAWFFARIGLKSWRELKSTRGI